MRYFVDFILIIYEPKEIFCRINVNVICESLATQISRLSQIRFWLFRNSIIKLLFFDLFFNEVIFYLSK